MENVRLVATNLREYGKGWQVNAFVDGVESEATYYNYTKSDALARARREIQIAGRLPHEPYRAEGALFSERKRQQILKEITA